MINKLLIYNIFKIENIKVYIMTQTVTKRDYSKSIIYKLCCKDPNITDIYIGSTINFKKRKYDHKWNCNNNIEKNKKYNLKIYKFIRDNGGFENWTMIMLEQYNCNNKKELQSRERYWIEELKSSLNSEIPTRTKQEYYEDYKDKILEKQKQYRLENKDKIKQHYINNKDKKLEYKNQKVNCDICNSIVNRNNLARHKKTDKCIKFQKLII